MDTERVEKLGAAPLADDLARIDAVGDVHDVVEALGGLERQAASGAFGMYVGPDSGNPDRYVVTMLQGGLGLPDEAYYREDQFATIRDAYRGHVAAMLTLAGLAEGRGTRGPRVRAGDRGSPPATGTASPAVTRSRPTT